MNWIIQTLIFSVLTLLSIEMLKTQRSVYTFLFSVCSPIQKSGEVNGAMKVRLWLLMLAGIIMILPMSGSSERSKFLDAALPFLEDGNPFVERYNELNSTEIKARFPLGCPYFWGGRHVKSILQPASPSSSSDYYHTDRR